MFASIIDISMIQEVWKHVGTELAVFAVTLVLALAIRSTNGGKANKKSIDEAPAQKLLRTTSERPAAPPASVGAAAPLRGGRQAPAAVLDDIVNMVKEQPSLRCAGRALQVYYEEFRPTLGTEGGRIQEIASFSNNSPTELFTTLVHCAIRAGRYHLVEGLLNDMVEQDVHRPLAFFESAMKQLAGQKQYHLALAMHDRLAADGLSPSAVTCSCLIGFAAEVGELQRAVEFFEKLSAASAPSIRAYMTILRVHAKRQDFKASVDILQDMERRGVGIDSLALNVVLATGVATDKLEACAKLITEVDKREAPITDVVSFNTLVKGYAQRGDSAGAFQTIAQMKARGLVPNAITFNTSMDAAVRSGDSSGAWTLLADMQGSGRRPDKFTCSIMVKSLVKGVKSHQVHAALALIKEADGALDQTLKSTLYHAVLDAAARVPAAAGLEGGVALPAKVFAQMRAQGVTPTQAAQRQLMQALPGMGR